MESLQPFGPQVKAILRQKDWSIRHLARLMERNPTFVSQVLRGLRRPPLAELDKWFVALEIPAADQAALRFAAELEHCPPGIQTTVRSLLDQTRP